MYEPDTILALKKPKGPDPETGEAFPYNRVRVVGASPVSHSQGNESGQWVGGDASGVLIVPLTNFGATLDEPFGKLRELYTVESMPENIVEAPKVRQYDATSATAGPTPEQVFAQEAPGVAPEPGQQRARTSPLEDVRPAANVGPLDGEWVGAEEEDAVSDSGVPTVLKGVPADGEG